MYIFCDASLCRDLHILSEGTFHSLSAWLFCLVHVTKEHDENDVGDKLRSHIELDAHELCYMQILYSLGLRILEHVLT
jgi:hypothetical protein